MSRYLTIIQRSALMYSYNEKDTVGKLVSNFWKISRVLRDTYDGRGSQRA